MSYFDYDAIFTCRRSVEQMIQHIFSNSHQNCSEIVSVDEIMGNKMNIMIGQRISWSGKIRQKRDFSPLYRNAAFFSMRGNLKTRHHRLKPILFAPLCVVTSCGQREPTGDKARFVWVTIFLGVFKKKKNSNSQNMFFSSWITTNLYQQNIQLDELCAVWVMTEESQKWYPACVLVPFMADQKGGTFDFILISTKSRHRTTILSYVSLQSFIYSLVFIPLQCKLLILATVQFNWPCVEKTFGTGSCSWKDQ